VNKTKILNCTLETCANDNACMDIKPNAMPKVTCESVAMEIMDSFLTAELENSNDATVRDTP